MHSAFDQATVMAAGGAVIGAGNNSDDLVVPINNNQRITLFVLGGGPDPVGNVEVLPFTKSGANSAVAMPVGTVLNTSLLSGVPGSGRNTDHQRQALVTGSKIVVPAAAVTGGFVFAITFDVPVLADGVDQLVLRCKNAGSVGSKLWLVAVGEQPRY